jgi:nuclear transcription factor Y gamma
VAPVRTIPTSSLMMTSNTTTTTTMMMSEEHPTSASSLYGGITGPANPTEEVPDSNSPAFQNQLNADLNEFWAKAHSQILNLHDQTEQDFKNHNDLPLARIKRIMKSDEDVRMISAEAPVLFAKACELFILDLSIRAWNYSQLHKRRTLQKEDVKEALQKTDVFDFLVDIIQ